MGFIEREAPSKLPTSVKELYNFYEVQEDIMSAPAWDFMYGATVEEGREKQFRSQGFTKEPTNIYKDTKNERVQLAEAALKACVRHHCSCNYLCIQRWSSARPASFMTPIAPRDYFVALETSVSLLQSPISCTKGCCPNLYEIQRNQSQVGCSRSQTRK